MRRRIAFVAAALALVAMLFAGGWAYRVARGDNGAVLLGAALAPWLPQVSLSGLEGSLRSGRASGIGWQSGGVRVTLRGLSWRLAGDCRGLRRICFEQFAVDELDIELEPADGGGGFPLAPLGLPFSFELQHATVGRLRILQGPRELARFDALELAARLRGSHLAVGRLRGGLGALQGELHGDIELRDHLPLVAGGRLAWGGEMPVAATLELRGDLQRLVVRAQGEDAWPIAAEGWIAPLAPDVELSLVLTGREPLVLWAERPEVGRLADAVLKLEGTLKSVRAELAGALRSPLLGENRVSAHALVSPAQLELQDARLAGDAGELSVRGNLAFDAARAWRLEAQLQKLHAPGMADVLDARFSGSAQLHGALAGGAPVLDATLALGGEINALPATLAGRVTIDARHAVQVQGLQLASGPNRLQLDGHAGDTVALDGSIAIPDLAATLRGAGGNGAGTLRIRGSRSAPELELHLELADPAWGDWRGSRLQLGVTGPAESLRLVADLRADGVALALDCTSSSAGDGAWQARCARFDAGRGGAEPVWQLQQPVALARTVPGGEVAVEPFCLREGSATLCSTQRAVFDAAGWRGIAIRGRSLPIAALGAWLPAAAQPQGTFEIQLDASKTGDAPLQLDASASAPALRLEFTTAGRVQPLELEDLGARLRTRGDGAELEGQARIGEAGRVDAALTITGRDEHAALAGTVALAGIDVGPLLRAVPGTLEARGRLDGQIAIAGSAGAPRLAGRMTLADGALGHERLPEPIHDIALAVDFDGPQARIDGRFATTAGEAGLRGTARWEGADWSADLHLDAERLRIEPLRGSTLSLVPALDITLGPRHAAVRGTVDVPVATIDIATVPQSAARVSDDAVEEGAPPKVPLFDYSLDVVLRLGEAVQFRGFGADARLTGGLRLTRRAGMPIAGRGEIRIAEGRYAAYGQRLEVTEGRLLFRGPLDRPALRFDAVRRIEDEPVTVGVRVRGDAREPELSVFSRPAMPESRALHYLLSGRAPAAGETTGLAAAGALMSLGASGASKLTGGTLGKLGIEDFEIGTRSVAGGTEVQLSGYLTPVLYLRYGVSTFDEVNTFRLRYRVTPSFFIEAISGVENAVDFLYSFER